MAGRFDWVVGTRSLCGSIEPCLVVSLCHGRFGVVHLRVLGAYDLRQVGLVRSRRDQVDLGWSWTWVRKLVDSIRRRRGSLAVTVSLPICRLRCGGARRGS